MKSFLVRMTAVRPCTVKGWNDGKEALERWKRKIQSLLSGKLANHLSLQPFAPFCGRN